MDEPTHRDPGRAAGHGQADPQHAGATGQPGADFARSDHLGAWLVVLRRYIVFIAVANLAWEFAQLPLYTLWYEGTAGAIIFAAVHCTGGDILISSASLLGSLIVLGSGRWPHERYREVAALTFVAGLGYTIFSEWLNTEIRGTWAYASYMPTVPLIGSGLSPLFQWIVIPLAAFWWARRPIQSIAPRTGVST